MCFKWKPPYNNSMTFQYSSTSLQKPPVTSGILHCTHLQLEEFQVRRYLIALQGPLRVPSTLNCYETYCYKPVNTHCKKYYK